MGVILKSDSLVMSNLRVVTSVIPQRFHRIINQGVLQCSVKNRSYHILIENKPRSSKKTEMKSLLNYLGMQQRSEAKSYSSSGKSEQELSEKAINNPKNMTLSEWHDLLDGQTFYVTREKGTERPWTSCLNDEKRKGTFICACCKQELFKSSAVRFYFLTTSFAERPLKLLCCSLFR